MKRDIAKLEAVTQFTKRAHEFCRLIETRNRLTKRAFVHKCTELIAKLQSEYVALLAVKTRPSAYRHQPEPFPYEQYRRLYQKLAAKFAQDNIYYLVFDPYKVDPDEPITATLSDDLADIYGDLKKGLSLIDRADSRDRHDAVWTWKFHFLVQTGHHCVSALRALQELLERYHEND